MTVNETMKHQRRGYYDDYNSTIHTHLLKIRI